LSLGRPGLQTSQRQRYALVKNAGIVGGSTS